MLLSLRKTFCLFTVVFHQQKQQHRNAENCAKHHHHNIPYILYGVYGCGGEKPAFNSIVFPFGLSILFFFYEHISFFCFLLFLSHFFSLRFSPLSLSPYLYIRLNLFVCVYHVFSISSEKLCRIQENMSSCSSMLFVVIPNAYPVAKMELYCCIAVQHNIDSQT